MKYELISHKNVEMRAKMVLWIIFNWFFNAFFCTHWKRSKFWHLFCLLVIKDWLKINHYPSNVLYTRIFWDPLALIKMNLDPSNNKKKKDTDMQKVATTRPLVAEIFSDCGRIKTGSPQNLWKSSTLFCEWPLIFMLTVCY